MIVDATAMKLVTQPERFDMMISFRQSAVLTLYTVLTFAITARKAKDHWDAKKSDGK